MNRDPSTRANLVVQLARILDADPVGNGVRWSIDTSDDLNVNLVHLDPGSEVATHVNAELDVLMVVIVGTGTLRIDGTGHELTIHAVALAPKGSARSITAGPEGMSYLTVHVRRPGLQIGSGPTGQGARAGEVGTR